MVGFEHVHSPHAAVTRFRSLGASPASGTSISVLTYGDDDLGWADRTLCDD